MSEEITAALEYLKSRRHDIGQGFLPSDSDKLHFWADGRACAFEHIRTLAALERMKASVGGINSWGMTELAVACLKLADSGKGDSKTVGSEARALHHQWKVLVASATPPPIHAKDADSIDAQARALAGRIADFLTTQLPYIS